MQNKIPRLFPAAFILLSVRPATAQEPAPPPMPRASFEISAISVFGDYYSSGLPNTSATFQSGALQTAGSNLSWNAGGGGSAQVDWRKFTERSTFFLSYIPSYTANWRYSSLNALNHAFTLNVSRKITPRLTLGYSAAANLSSYAESLFTPTATSSVAAAPANFQDLAAGLLSANFANNPLLGVLLTNAPLVQSPVNELVYGQRVLTASVSTSISHSISPRFSIAITGSGNRTQSISSNQIVSGANAYLLPVATSESAGVTLSYSLSPLTQIGASVTTSHSSSTLFDGYTNISQATIGRTLEKRWILQAHVGVAVTDAFTRGTIAAQTNASPTGGGSLAYKAGSHTFLGSFDRATAATYGLGASTSSSASGTWRWRPPASSWWLEAAFTWQEFAGGGLLSTSGWRSTFGWTRWVGTHTLLLTQYVYASYVGGMQTAQYHSSQSAVRFTVTWIPRPVTATQ